MRVETEAAGPPRTPPGQASSVLRRPIAPRPKRSFKQLDGFEWLVLLAFAAISLWVGALDLYQVIAHGRVWTGTDGVYIVDQMQYLAWIRDASHHLLVSNLFVLRNTPADYFQPAVAVSGGLVALGMAPWLALMLWKPVAVLVAFWAVRVYVRRSVPDGRPRRAALALALFFGSFSVIYGSFGVVGDLFMSFLSWGYTFGLLALGVMILALLAYEQGRHSASARAAAVPALLGMLASLLHPWQGELLILIILGTEAWMWRGASSRPASLWPFAVTILATGLPLVYYVILGRADESWHLARIASKHVFPLLSIALALAPLALAAIPAYLPRPGRPATFLGAATRMWPLGALVIYAVSASDVSATPLHAFEGVTVPLAVLAVEGVRRLGFARLRRAPAWATLLVAATTAPAVVYLLHTAGQLATPSPGNPNFIARDEQRALRYLAHDRTPGGILTRFYLGSVVPAATGRRTFVGDCLWSEPNCDSRAVVAQQIFDGTLSAKAARAAVLATGARFVLADCQTRPDMDAAMAPIAASVRHFGCAAVYEVSAPSPPSGPLAESEPDAALRASGRQQRGVQSS